MRVLGVRDIKLEAIYHRAARFQLTEPRQRALIHQQASKRLQNRHASDARATIGVEDFARREQRGRIKEARIHGNQQYEIDRRTITDKHRLADAIKREAGLVNKPALKAGHLETTQGKLDLTKNPLWKTA